MDGDVYPEYDEKWNWHSIKFMKIWRLNFFEQYLYIAEAMENLYEGKNGLWDPKEDDVFYDMCNLATELGISLKLRSIVGLIPMFAVEVIEHEMLQNCLILPKEWTGF